LSFRHYWDRGLVATFYNMLKQTLKVVRVTGNPKKNYIHGVKFDGSALEEVTITHALVKK